MEFQMLHPPRMRFPAQALAELKKDDPDTPISLNYIRRLAKSGKISVEKIGRRTLINYDSLLEYLNSLEADEPIFGKIRRIG